MLEISCYKTIKDKSESLSLSLSLKDWKTNDLSDCGSGGFRVYDNDK